MKGYASRMLVAEEGRQPLGFITCLEKSINGHRYAVIDLLAVESNRRSKGIGRLLVSRMLEELAGRVDEVYVGTPQTNLPAVNLYASLGFKAVSLTLTLHKKVG